MVHSGGNGGQDGVALVGLARPAGTRSAVRDTDSTAWRTLRLLLMLRLIVCAVLCTCIGLGGILWSDRWPDGALGLAGVLATATLLGLLYYGLALANRRGEESVRGLIFLIHSVDIGLATAGVFYFAEVFGPENAFIGIPIYALIVVHAAITLSVAGAYGISAAGALAYGALRLTPLGGQWPALAPVINAVFLPLLAFFTTQLAEAMRREMVRSRAHKLDAEHVRAREEYFRAMVEHSSDLIAIVSPDGVLRYVSPSHGPVMGYASDDLVGHEAAEFIHPRDLPSLAELMTKSASGRRFSMAKEVRFRHKDRTWRVIEGIATSRIDDPVIAGVVVNSRDVTERRQAERRLGAAYAQLARLNRELELMTKAVSHDMRNPLTAAQEYLRGLDDAPPGEHARLLHQARASLRSASAMLDGLQDVIERAGAAEEPQSVSTEAMLRTVIKEVRAAPGQSPSIALEGTLGDIEAPPTKLAHVFRNLLDNAVKHSGDHPRVEVGQQVRGDDILFWVRDNGPGIPFADQDKIFDPFWRGPHQNGDGIGLGLTLVRQIVEQLDGTVWVESDPGQGTTFWIALPHSGHHQDSETGGRHGPRKLRSLRSVDGIRRARHRG